MQHCGYELKLYTQTQKIKNEGFHNCAQMSHIYCSL